MRFLGFMAVLAGLASAAPSSGIHGISKRAATAVSQRTRINSSGPSKVIVTKDNTLNGTYTGGDSMRVSSLEVASSAEPQIPLRLVNNLGGQDLKCYISGADSDGRVFFLGADGNLIYPTSGGSSTPVPISEPIAIDMPAKGETYEITVPISFSSGRVYFSEGELEFFMTATETGEGLVQPSINNLEDPSRGLNWGFVELTLTPEGVIWANISFVDFVGLIMSMTLNNRDNSSMEVVGLPGDAVETICDELASQGDEDGLPWGAMCIAADDGTPLRVISPNNYESIEGGAFDDYWSGYVDEVWDLYSSETLSVDTQTGGNSSRVACRVSGDELECDGDSRGYPKPTALDIWGCNSGPFGIMEGDNGVHKAVVPRLCAAFVRTTLTIDGGDEQPGPPADRYYSADPTSHYSRIVHANEVDGKGYAFPYDDVNPTGSDDAAGLVSSGNPAELVFYIGGAQ